MKTGIIKRNKWLSEKIKKNWDHLSDDEIESYHHNPDRFYSAVKTKYGMFRDNAEDSIKKIKSGYGFFKWRD